MERKTQARIVSADALIAAGPREGYPPERLRRILPGPVTLQEFFDLDDSLFDLPKWDRLLFMTFVLPPGVIHRLALLGAFRLRHRMGDVRVKRALRAKCRYLKGRMEEDQLRAACAQALVAFGLNREGALEVGALASLPEPGAFALRAAIKAAGPSGSEARQRLFREICAEAVRLVERRPEDS